MLKFATYVLLLGLLTGCTLFRGPDDYSKAKTVLSGDDGSLRVDLFEALISESNADDCYLKEYKRYPDNKAATDNNKTKGNLECAFASFYSEYKREREPSLNLNAIYQLKRNRVIDRLLAASDQSCNEYITNLQGASAQQGFTFGSLTTLLAGAGSIVSGENAARTLSGTAGIVSGVDAKFKESFFSNFAIHVLSPGIRVRRSQLLILIEENKKRPLADYTLEMGIKDAIAYHGSCNMITGLEVASEAVNAKISVENIRQQQQQIAGQIGTLTPEQKQIQTQAETFKNNENVKKSLKAIDQIKQDLDDLRTQLSIYLDRPPQYQDSAFVVSLQRKIRIKEDALSGEYDNLQKEYTKLQPTPKDSTPSQ